MENDLYCIKRFQFWAVAVHYNRVCKTEFKKVYNYTYDRQWWWHDVHMRESVLRNMFASTNADADTKDQEQTAVSNTSSFLWRPSLPSTLSSYNNWLNEESPESQFNTAEPESEQRTTLTTPDNDQEWNAILNSSSFESSLGHSTYYQSGGDSASNLQNYAGHLLQPQLSSTAGPVSGATDFTNISPLSCTSQYNPGLSNSLFFNQETCGRGLVRSLRVPYQEERNSTSTIAWNNEHHESSRDLTSNPKNYKGMLLGTQQFTSTADFGSLPNVSSSFRRVSLSQEEGHFTSNMAAYNYKYHQSGGDLTTNPQNYQSMLIGAPQFTSLPNDSSSLSYVLPSQEEGRFGSNMAAYNYKHYQSGGDLTRNLQHHNGLLIESPQFPSTADSKYWQNDLTHSSSFSSVSSFQQEGKNPSTTITNYKHHKLGRTMATNVPTQKGSLFGTSHLSSTVDVEYGHTHSSNSQHLLNEGNSNLNQTNKHEWKKYPKQFQGGTGPGFNMRADNHDKHLFTHQKHSNPLKSMENHEHHNLPISEMTSTSDMAHIIGPSVQSFPIINDSINLDDQHTNNASLKDSFSENGMENFKLVSHNKNQVGFVCSECGKGYRFKQSYKHHLRTHKTDIEAKCPFKCDQCIKRFADGRSLKQHTLSHGAEAKFRCYFCPKGFMTKDKLNSHLRVHATTEEAKYPFKCVQAQCPARFSSKVNLERHNMKDHGAKAKFQCDYCSKGFMTNWHLKVHLNVHDTNIEVTHPFECEECAKRYTCKRDLKRHTLKHGAKHEFTCGFCQKGFMLTYDLKRHISQIHKTTPDSNNFPFECNERFTDEQYLKRHRSFCQGATTKNVGT